MKISRLLVISSLLVVPGLAQDLESHSWELSGTLSYDYSNTITPYGRIATWYDKSDRLEVTPEVGYYFSDYLQAIVGIDYSWSAHRHNSFQSGPPDTPPPGEFHGRTDIHRAGLYAGAAIHIPVSDNLRLFVGGRVGASATWYSFQLHGTSTSNGETRLYKESYRRPVDKAELTAPSGFVGVKFGLASDWSINTKVLYSETADFEGYSNHYNYSLSVGFGISKYF
jgi:hypothetical protein